MSNLSTDVFRMIAAGNTDGQGRNEVYQARGKIDESVQQRFTPVYLGYDEEIEKAILAKYKDWLILESGERKIIRLMESATV